MGDFRIKDLSLRQIAAMAGVSAKSVSCALRGRPGVAPGTRERIQRIAARLGYQIHGPARALASGRTGLVAVVPGMLGMTGLAAWDALIVNGLIEVFNEQRTSVVILACSSDERIPRELAQRSVDAAAFLLAPHDDVFVWSRQRSIPCVCVNFDPGGDVDRVLADDDGGMRQVVAYLASLGHRRIGYVTGHSPNVPHDRSRKERIMGYCSAMAERGLVAPPGYEQYVPAEERMEALIASEPPTAYVCYNDHVAMQVVQVLHRKGIRVPEEASVIGVDDVYEARFSSPALTTVRVPFKEMGVRAAEMLSARMPERGRPCEKTVLPEKLVIRESAAPPRAT